VCVYVCVCVCVYARAQTHTHIHTHIHTHTHTQTSARSDGFVRVRTFRQARTRISRRTYPLRDILSKPQAAVLAAKSTFSRVASVMSTVTPAAGCLYLRKAACGSAMGSKCEAHTPARPLAPARDTHCGPHACAYDSRAQGPGGARGGGAGGGAYT